MLQGAPSQVQYTLVPLVFRALGLARNIRAAELAEEEQSAAAESAAVAAAASKKASAAKTPADTGKLSAPQSAEGPAESGEASDGDGGEGGVVKEEGDGSPTEPNGVGNGDNGSVKEVGGEAEAGGGDETAAAPAPEASENEGDKEAESSPPSPPQAATPAAPARPRQFSSRKAYQFLHEIVTAMAPLHPWVSLSLFLQCAIGADHTGFKAIAYEFFSQVGPRVKCTRLGLQTRERHCFFFGVSVRIQRVNRHCR